MPVVTAYIKRKQVGVFTCEEGVISIGRHPDSTVFLPNQSVSREHATIEQLGDTWLLADAGGRNGVWFGGQRIKEKSLTSGDKFEIGVYLLHFDLLPMEKGARASTGQGGETGEARAESEGAVAPTGMESHDATFMMRPEEILRQRKQTAKSISPHVEHLNSDNQAVVTNLKALKSVIGSAEDATIRIPSGLTVGKQHALIERRRDLFFIAPVSWLYRIQVNGQKVTDAEQLNDGDKIKIGGQELTFHDALFNPKQS